MRFISAAGSGFGLDDLPVAAIQKLGIDRENDLRVEWVRVRGGVKAMEALIDGEGIVAYGGYGAALLKSGEGSLKIVASTTCGLAQELVGKAVLPRSKADRKIRWGVDGIGAMSHQLAREIVMTFGLEESKIEFVVSGPPEDRIHALLDGSVDASLLRLEESLDLTKKRRDSLGKILTFEEINARVLTPVHGVIATTDDNIKTENEIIQKVVECMLLSNRALNSDFVSFEKAMKSVSRYQDGLQDLWGRVTKAGLFAVNGGMNGNAWKRKMENYFQHLDQKSVNLNSVTDHSFVGNALKRHGTSDAHWDVPSFE
ncbi:MAG: hypothetical protein JRN20_04165 [Nitrososphaerota archaeon]|nr:hypothetical protein [Nitrososphaerota archaeon]MDG6923688.1 hypothetical protein [Nitrososphaerota archaeon]